MATKVLGSLGTIDTLTVGGRTFTDLSGIIILHAQIQTANRFGTFRKANASSGYQITTGKTFHIYAMSVSSPTGTNTGGVFLLYGDTDVGQNSASAPTNFVNMIGDSSFFASQFNSGTGLAATATLPGFDFPCPALKYMAFSATTATASCTIYGYEV